MGEEQRDAWGLLVVSTRPPYRHASIMIVPVSKWRCVIYLVKFVVTVAVTLAMPLIMKVI